MTAKNILERAAELIGANVNFNSSGETQSAFLSCLGYVLGELSTQYERLKHEEVVTSSDGKILYSTLEKKVVHILSIKKDERKVRFTAFPTYVKVKESGELTVTYSYSQDQPTVNEVIALPPKYTVDVLALGVASEYLHRTGYEEDSLFFGNRYFTALKNISIPHKDIVLPVRRYL